MNTNARRDKPGTDPGVKAAVITGIATVLVAVIGAASAFAVGWLQYRGPGSAESTQAVTTTLTTASGANSAPDTTPPASTSSESTPQTQALLDLVPVDEETWETGGGDLDGRDYPGALLIGLCPPAISGADQTYLVRRQFSRFQALVGIDDASQVPVPMIFTVSGDEQTLFRRTIGVGKPVRIDVPIRDVVRFQLAVETDPATVNASGCFDDTTAVWAQTRLLR